MAYEGGQQVILPGYVRNAQDCWTQCSMTLYCAYFTWKAAPNRSLGLIGPGGCLKFNDQATLVPAAGPASETISGFSTCPTVAPALAPNASNGTIPSAPEVLGAPQLPTGTLVNGTGAAGDSAGGKGSGGFWPWWAVLLVALVVIAIGAVLVFSGMGGGSAKGKKSKRPKKSAREEEEDNPDMEALVRAEAPLPTAEPAAPQVDVPGAPLPQLQGIQAGLPQRPQQEPAFGPQGQTFVMQPQGAAFVQPVPAHQLAAVQRPQLR